MSDCAHTNISKSNQTSDHSYSEVVHQCDVPNCYNSATFSDGIYKFPTLREHERLEIWLKRCMLLHISRKRCSRMKICQNHFIKSDFINEEGDGWDTGSLRPDALPSKNLPPEPSTKVTYDMFIEKEANAIKQRMYKCIVPNCCHKGRIGMFKFPDDKSCEKFNVWFAACRPDPCKIYKNSKICWKHFNESDFYLTKNQFTNTNLFAMLKDFAVPSKNLHMPYYTLGVNLSYDFGLANVEAVDDTDKTQEPFDALLLATCNFDLEKEIEKSVLNLHSNYEHDYATEYTPLEGKLFDEIKKLSDENQQLKTANKTLQFEKNILRHIVSTAEIVHDGIKVKHTKDTNSLKKDLQSTEKGHKSMPKKRKRKSKRVEKKKRIEEELKLSNDYDSQKVKIEYDYEDIPLATLFRAKKLKLEQIVDEKPGFDENLGIEVKNESVENNPGFPAEGFAIEVKNEILENESMFSA